MRRTIVLAVMIPLLLGHIAPAVSASVTVNPPTIEGAASCYHFDSGYYIGGGITKLGANYRVGGAVAHLKEAWLWSWTPAGGMVEQHVAGRAKQPTNVFCERSREYGGNPIDHTYWETRGFVAFSVPPGQLKKLLP